MRAWKTAGVLVDPKGTTKYSWLPDGALKDHFPLVPLLNTDQVIRVPEDQFSKNTGPLLEFKGRGYEGQILNINVIQATIINTGPERLILLFNKEEPCSCRGEGRSNYASTEQFQDVFSHGICLRSRQGIQTASQRAGTREEINHTVIREM